MIKVHNSSGYNIEVAVNRWGKDGNTDFFTIDNDRDENWDREDGRGFVMVVSRDGANRSPYYVHANSNIIVNNTSITDSGIQKNPIS